MWKQQLCYLFKECSDLFLEPIRTEQRGLKISWSMKTEKWEPLMGFELLPGRISSDYESSTIHSLATTPCCPHCIWTMWGNTLVTICW